MLCPCLLAHSSVVRIYTSISDHAGVFMLRHHIVSLVLNAIIIAQTLTASPKRNGQKKADKTVSRATKKKEN